MKKNNELIQTRSNQIPTNESNQSTPQGHSPTPGFINPHQAASYLGCSTRYLEIVRKQGNGPKFYRLSSKMIKYRISDLDEWMTEHLCSSTTEGSVRHG